MERCFQRGRFGGILSLQQDVKDIAITEKSNLTVNIVLLISIIGGIVWAFLQADRVDARSLDTAQALQIHLVEVAGERTQYRREMRFLMNSVIRLQAERNIKIPKDELQDIDAQ